MGSKYVAKRRFPVYTKKDGTRVYSVPGKPVPEHPDFGPVETWRTFASLLSTGMVADAGTDEAIRQTTYARLEAAKRQTQRVTDMLRENQKEQNRKEQGAIAVLRDGGDKEILALIGDAEKIHDVPVKKLKDLSGLIEDAGLLEQMIEDELRGERPRNGVTAALQRRIKDLADEAPSEGAMAFTKAHGKTGSEEEE